MHQQSDPLKHVGKPLRKSVLLALLWLTAVSGIGFCALNISHNASYVLAAAEAGMALYSFFLIYKLNDIEQLRRVTLLYLIPFFSVMMLALVVPNTSVTIFGWVLLIPIISHLLLGRRIGLIMSLFYMSVAAGIFWVQHHDDPALLDTRAIANVVVLSVCILACSHVYELSRERSEQYLALTARTDFLTGLNNRLGFSEAFGRERKRALRSGSGLAMLLIDLDHFKRINDRYGHDVGDLMLGHVADTLAGRLRDSDTLARLGGEEFGVLLVDTSPGQARDAAQALCEAVARRPLPYRGEAIPVTLSAGIAHLEHRDSTLESLYATADERLYRAKSAGRNRVEGPPMDGASPAAPIHAASA